MDIVELWQKLEKKHNTDYDFPLPFPSSKTTCNKPRTAKVGAISKAQNLKGGPFGLCETPAGCKKFEKNLRGTLWRHEKISQKIFLMRFLNSVTVPKNVKGGPFACVAKYRNK